MADVVVVGSGAGGLTAALTSSLLGLSVEVLEKAPIVGGTSALSAGSVWIPNSHHAADGDDSLDQARRYLAATVGNRLKPDLAEAFLEQGPRMVRFLEDRSEVAFRAYPRHPDYLADAEGATLAGRALEPLPYDGRRLGEHFRRLRDPLPEFTLLGGMMVDRGDIGHLLGARRSLASLRHAVGILARHVGDRLHHHRGTRLVMGNALVARLYASLLAQGVSVRTGHGVTGLMRDSGRVSGVETDGGERIEASRGVVLASGGARFAEIAYSPRPDSVSGEGVAWGVAAGGRLGEGHTEQGFWTPVSLRRRGDGSTAVFPHFVLDRGKPGLIAVDRAGRRFVNEAIDYHRFGKALREHGTACHFVCDDAFIRKYGLGMVHPGAANLRGALADGYVTRADSLATLAARLDIDAGGLEEAVGAHNRYTERGVDEDFGKGSNAYERNLGDPAHGPNPCLGAIATPPFYAIEVHCGDIGASVGLVTDAAARVLDANGAPIAGLYACGNDMDSLMAGAYPGPGITLGPAMTFGYIAANHMADAG